ncbi:MAG: 1-deoxy-D-xylulose-5-phosphate reductoisomerase [Planctomycetales bacterium]|nr:1-deoxy-D-xylulose-5-phosphate reductoisomerase [Planctomycetales bacterium]
MNQTARNIAVLGATGSIGRSTLEVVRHLPGQFRTLALTAHRSVDRLLQQAADFSPRWLVVTDETAAGSLSGERLPHGADLLHGAAGLETVAAHPEVDVVVAAIVGSAGLLSTWAAVDAGKTVALANKETLVVAGPLVMRRAAETGARILPVDSEHSAVFQALSAGRREEVKRIVLTASGGPFRNHTRDQLQHVTVEQALAHPTWDMGPKITIDSATMMNKALEMIEARWLFDVAPDQIDVVIHPQSVVHSLVEYVDGSIVAQLSPPDMKLPIQYALTWPHRAPSPAPTMDLSHAWRLDFEPPDEERFPALRLGRQVAASGGTAGAALNAANEAAVAEFLAGRLQFMEIVPACESVLQSHHFEPNPTLEQLLAVDRWARKEITQWVCT